ncbi:MAG: hypothetical protein M1469_05610 [Bacteroidetes bacterium]|nr:hypothetical protein [Bacteroidota bacterium]MCL5267563.1 hypothetical protein [Bacteroidota bacterium]
MKYLITSLAIALTAFMPTSSITFQDARASADPNSGAITLQWSTLVEDGVKDFIIQKASQVNGEYITLDRVAATGSGSIYQYVDRAIYKTTSSTLFQYQIVAEDMGGNAIGSTQCTVVYTFSQSLSGVARRTWGSIKAMFR